MKSVSRDLALLRKSITVRSMRAIRWKLVAVFVAIMFPTLIIFAWLAGLLYKAPDWITYALAASLAATWIWRNARVRRA